MKNLEIKNIQNNTIFKEINPYDNLLINTLSQKDLLDIFKLISNYLLEYRKRIEIDSKITFGTEIEFENIKNPGRVNTEFLELFSDDDYSITNDGTLTQSILHPKFEIEKVYEAVFLEGLDFKKSKKLVLYY